MPIKPHDAPVSAALFISLTAVISLLLLSHAPTADAFVGDVPGLQGHKQITRDGLNHLQPFFVGHIRGSNVDQDQGATKNNPVRHAQACRFREMAAWYNKAADQVLDNLDPETSGTAPNHVRAARIFGAYLHGVQDFYSHSNWLYLAQSGIFNNGLGKWPSLDPYTPIEGRNFVLIEGDGLPEGARVVMPTVLRSGVRYFPDPVGGTQVVRVEYKNVAFPDGFVPNVWLGNATAPVPGLMTSNSKADDGVYSCPPVGVRPCRHTPETLRQGTARWGEGRVCQDHGEGSPEPGWAMNFDRTNGVPPSTSGSGRKRARDLATLQTRHEWCRLLHRAKDRRNAGAQDRYWLPRGSRRCGVPLCRPRVCAARARVVTASRFPPTGPPG